MKNRHLLAALAVPVLGVSLALSGGCSRTMVREPLPVDGANSADLEKQLDFWHSLPGRSAVSNNEGLHGLILFLEGQDPHETYDARVSYAKEKGWLPGSFNEPGEMVMQRGTLARAIAKGVDIKGGVMMRVTGGNARYAARELQYLGIMGESTDMQALSGLDYVGVISKVQDWQTTEEIRKQTKRPTARIRPVPPREENSAAGQAGEGQSGTGPTEGGQTEAPAPEGTAPAGEPAQAPEPQKAEPGQSEPKPG